MEHLTERAKEIAYSETRRLLDNTRSSKALYERALHSLPQGVFYIVFACTFAAILTVLQLPARAPATART